MHTHLPAQRPEVVALAFHMLQQVCAPPVHSCIEVTAATMLLLRLVMVCLYICLAGHELKQSRRARIKCTMQRCAAHSGIWRLCQARKHAFGPLRMPRQLLDRDAGPLVPVSCALLRLVATIGRRRTASTLRSGIRHQ